MLKEETNKFEINGARMIDIRLVNSGRRLMNSKERKKKTGTACFFCYSHGWDQQTYIHA